MGRVNNQTPAASPPLNHFSHLHDLYPTPPNLTPATSHCSGCELQSTGTMYTCLPCNFTLHQSCAKLPRRITHPSHGGCTLSLVISAAYPGGAFSCDACARNGKGWSYNCTRCEYDLHVSCAVKPLKIRHRSHSCELELTFKNPYVNADGFSCDICRRTGSKQWLYRCGSCEFDVHLDCTTATLLTPALHHHQSLPAPTSHPQYNHQLMHSSSTGQLVPPRPTVAAGFPAMAAQPHLVHSASTGGIPNPYGVNQFPGTVNAPPAAAGGLGNNLMMAAVQGFVEGAFQGVGQAVVQDVIGGGSGGGSGDGSGGDGGDGTSY